MGMRGMLEFSIAISDLTRRFRQELFKRDDAVFPYNRHEVRVPTLSLPTSLTFKPRSTRRFRVVSLSPTCFSKSQKYIAAYRFFRLLSDLCPQISKPTPEDFFNAFMNHHAKAGIRV
jgi:hypothetical protein